jgi:hypothetical protein
MANSVLANKDANAAMVDQQQASTKDVKSMDYHRQVFQDKMRDEQYVDQPYLAFASFLLECPVTNVSIQGQAVHLALR